MMLFTTPPPKTRTMADLRRYSTVPTTASSSPDTFKEGPRPGSREEYYRDVDAGIEEIARRRRGERSQHDAAFAISHSSFANPTPVGFMSLSVSAFAVALVNFGARGVSTSTYLAAPAIWVGGLGQLLTGMWEMAGGNTLGATGFTVYGLWWISWGYSLSAWSGIAEAYANNAEEMTYIAGFYSIGYFLFSMCLVVTSLRTSLALTSIFLTLGLSYLMHGIGAFAGSYSSHFTVAAGLFNFLTSLASLYTAFADLLTSERSYFHLPVGDMSRGWRAGWEAVGRGSV